MPRARLLAIIATIGFGCDHASVVTTAPIGGEGVGTAGVCRDARDVELHLTRPPTRPYEEVALVRVLGNQGSNSATQLASLRARTAALCGDAVVQVSHGTQQRPTVLCNDCDYDAEVLWGVAVRYSGDGDQTHPDDRARAEALITQAHAEELDGNGWAAADLLRRAVGVDPLRHEAAARLAARRLDAKHAVDAIALYRLAVLAAPDHAAYRRGLADALSSQGQHREARMQYDSAATLGDPEATTTMADLKHESPLK